MVFSLLVRQRGGNHKMKFLVVFCLLALAAADEDKTTDKKIQPIDAAQNPSALAAQPQTPLNGQVFPPASFANVFGTNDPIANLAYTGFNTNVSPIQTVNPDFFSAQTAGVVNGAIQNYPITRAVLPGTSAVVNGIQSAFPVAGNVFPAVAPIPAAVNSIQSQFPAGIIPAVTGVSTGAIDPNTAANGAISAVPGTALRFLTPETFTGIPTQGLQTAQQVGLAAIPAFTSGILPSLGNNVLQGQNIPSAIQQVLKNPTGGNPAGVSNVQGLTGGNIPSGPLTNVFRHA